jgi:hypothetical protein
MIQGRNPDGTPTNYEEFNNLSPLNNIKQQERLEIIANELISCKSKKKIIEEYTEKWQCCSITVKRIIDETIAWMAETAKMSANEYRVLNSERLDTMLDEADKVGDKIKIIDMLNRTNNVYDTNVKVSTNEPITIDLGV